MKPSTRLAIPSSTPCFAASSICLSVALAPFDLASSIHDGDFLKPVRVVKSKDVTGKCDYELVEGRIRFWAWVIAHEGKMPIPAYVRYS